MTAIDNLRESILKIFQGKTPSVTQLNTLFHSNLENIYNNVCVDTKTDISILKKRCQTNEFSNFYNQLRRKPETKILDFELIKPPGIDKRTIEGFLINKKTIQGRSLDVFAVVTGNYGWIEFEEKFELEYLKSLVAEKKQIEQNVGNELIQIPGVSIIDSEFISQIRKGTDFSALQFYTFKYDDNGQWFGVINNFDVERKQYGLIKQIIESSFQQFPKRTFKVALIITGEYGSGKNTLLKRLSIDFCNEFCVLWINQGISEGEINALLQQIINSNENFLIIIYDWENTFRTQQNASLFLQETDKINNVRIVIGDYDSKDKEYENHLFSSDAIIKLSAFENKEMLKVIITKYPTWADFGNNLINKNDEYTPLFIQLYIIAEMHSKSNGELVELSQSFIVLKKTLRSFQHSLVKSNEGLAKALYYYACLQREANVYISVATFLSFADYFNGNNNIKRYRYLTETPSELKPFMNNKNGPVLYFNHEIIASGFSQICLSSWKEYDPNIIKELINLTLKSGHWICQEVMFYNFFFKSPDFFSDDEIVFYVNQMIKNKNPMTLYPNTLFNVKELSDEDLDEYAKNLLEIANYSTHFFGNFLRKVKEPMKTYWLTLIFSSEYSMKFEAEFIVELMEEFGTSHSEFLK